MKSFKVPFLLIVVMAMVPSGCVVSKKDYLLKEEEAERCTHNLMMQVEENKTLKAELSDCQGDLSKSEARVEELTASLARVSGERDQLESRLTVQRAVNEEMKIQNERLTDILQKKEVSQSAIIKETMEINKRLQDTNTELRERLAVTEVETGRMEKELDALEARNAELERQKEAELRKLKATYDELVESLKGEIEAGEIQIRRMKDRLSVNLVEKILFDSGKADLKGSGIEVLRKVGAQLARIEGKRVQIEGHTDNVPIGGRLRERFPTN